MLRFSLRLPRLLLCLALLLAWPAPFAAAQQALSLTPLRDALPLRGAVPVMPVLMDGEERLLLDSDSGRLVFSLQALTLRPASADEAARALPLPGAAYQVRSSNGIIRWFSATPPERELLALLVLDPRRFVLWTPPGYYHAHGDGSDEAIGVWTELADGHRRFLPVRELGPGLAQPDEVRGALLARRPERPLAPLAAALPRVGRVITPSDDDDIVRGPGARATVEIYQPNALPASEPTREPGQRGLARVGSAPSALDRVEWRQSWREFVPFAVPPPPGPGEPHERTVWLRPPAMGGRAVALPLTWQRGWHRTRPDLYVLTVGVNSYQELAALGYAAKDARDVAGVLGAQAGRRYRHVYRTVLTDQEATLPRLRQALRWLRSAAREEDMVMLFLGGHGITAAVRGEPHYFFLPVETSLSHLTETALSDDELFWHLASLRSESVIVYLDTCKAGASPAQRRLLERLRTDTGLVVFSATQANRPSRESPRWQNGVFTRALVEGLGGAADLKGDGRVTAGSLETYLGQRVRELSDGDQEPTTIKASRDLWIAAHRPKYQRRWWLWTAVGAVVAGAAAGIAVVSTRASATSVDFWKPEFRR